MSRMDSESIEQTRAEAHRALDGLLDSVRDARIVFGRAILEITFHQGRAAHRRTTIERTERISGPDASLPTG